MLSHVEKIALKSRDGVVLVHIISPKGAPYYAYLQAEAEKIDALNRAFEGKKPIKLSEYGRVLFMGKGEDPTPEIAERIRKKYILSE